MMKTGNLHNERNEVSHRYVNRNTRNVNTAAKARAAQAKDDRVVAAQEAFKLAQAELKLAKAESNSNSSGRVRTRRKRTSGAATQVDAQGSDPIESPADTALTGDAQPETALLTIENNTATVGSPVDDVPMVPEGESGLEPPSLPAEGETEAASNVPEPFGQDERTRRSTKRTSGRNAVHVDSEPIASASSAGSSRKRKNSVAVADVPPKRLKLGPLKNWGVVRNGEPMSAITFAQNHWSEFVDEYPEYVNSVLVQFFFIV
ncbi:hypothetical protein R3P38DRAFT_2997787 [Favolaschia claudopus]|uniref:Uncharacterized protein n=1 Tax=Favolaschia claudopus TaxID=2862362 RepID=A0AAW0ANR5_9AGAR